MKKSILLLTIIFSLSFVVLSCKDNTKQNSEMEIHEIHSAESGKMVIHDVYQCPMDCEIGKTYAEEGSCPVCKMDLQKVKK